jgi:putative endonuclease
MGIWYVYIVRCSDHTCYTGIAKDLEKRITEHNTNDRLGARYTQSRRPVQLVYVEEAANRSVATKRELEIKQFTKKKKENLIAQYAHSLDKKF